MGTERRGPPVHFGTEMPMIVRTEAELRQAMRLDAESEHLEFKEAKSDYDFDKLADYCCALGSVCLLLQSDSVHTFVRRLMCTEHT